MLFSCHTHDMTIVVVPSRYLVRLDAGQDEGPYTVEEMRQRLTNGKLPAQGRIQDTATLKSGKIIDLIPEAEDLERIALSSSDSRILRRTIDRVAALQHRPPTEPTAKDTPPPATHAVATERATLKTSWAIRGGLIALGLAASLALAWLNFTAWTGGTVIVPQEPLNPHGRFAVDQLATRELIAVLQQDAPRMVLIPRTEFLANRLSETTLSVIDANLFITSAKKSESVQIQVANSSEQEFHLKLAVTHPILGESFALVQDGPTVFLEIQDLRVPLKQVP